ncbi:MAG TPA: L,D-transpeptidase [Steroidobacteraceae bacterium]|nr:L,D-transpeptidase [Steroidobacteraceae bacterium]
MMLAAGLALVAATAAAKTPFWGARESRPADTPFTELAQGEFIWLGDASRGGPLLLVVSIDEQRAYVYRNGVLTGVSTVSTGKKGYETPTGVFTILQKNKDHYSNLYDDAPMPYMQRLTWGGIALHAGGLPGYPASHGCIRLPSEFARRLFEVTSTGMTVVVASHASELSNAASPGFLAPLAPTGEPATSLPLMPSESLRWQPELAPEGPLSAVLSRQSGRVIVYRSGVEIGRARVVFHGREPIGTHVLLLVEGAASTPQRYVSKRDQQHWVEVDIAGHDRGGAEPDPGLGARLELPPEFVARVNEILVPGTTVLVTDEMITPATSGPRLEVINSEPPEE